MINGLYNLTRSAFKDESRDQAKRVTVVMSHRLYTTTGTDLAAR